MESVSNQNNNIELKEMENMLTSDQKKIPKQKVWFSCLSLLTFWWFTDIILKGYKTPLTAKDIPQISNNNTSFKILKKFYKYWSLKTDQLKQNVEKNRTHVYIRICPLILNTFWSSMLAVALIKLIASIMTILSPIVMDRLIDYLKVERNESDLNGYSYALLLFIIPMVESIFSNQYEYNINQVSMRVRVCLMSFIYRKGLNLSSYGRKNYTTGEIVNLMSIDTQRVTDFVYTFNQYWSSILQIILIFILLWQQLGVASLSGIILMLLLQPSNLMIMNKVKTMIGAAMKEKDKRTKLLNEMLIYAKVVKMYAWESFFLKRITRVRRLEAILLNKLAFMKSIMIASYSLNVFVGLVSFATYVLMDSNNKLDANKAFVSLTLFNLIRQPMGVSVVMYYNTIQFIVSLKRIEKYLNSDEINENAVTHKEVDAPIVIKSGSFSWSKDSEPTLRDVSLNIQKNKLIAIVGQVGSGKSSLLAAILGEMEKLDGSVNTFGSIAYVPQEAWIQNSTLKKNILFTNYYDENTYEKVIESCALMPDIKILPAGDLTEIGEKGINLSGGQKQRISLARAVYSDSDIYLLDDPLSAVDAHVGRHLFDKVIGPNGMLRDKTRLLVTHQISILPFVDEIIVLKDGRISEIGTFNNLVTNKGDFSEVIEEFLTHASNRTEELKSIEELKPILNSSNILSNDSEANTNELDVDSADEHSLLLSTNSINKIGVESKTKLNDVSLDQNKIGSKLVEVEAVETKKVTIKVYYNYLNLFGFVIAIALTFLFIACNLTQVGSGLWLIEWSKDASVISNETNRTDNKQLRIAVYGGLGLLDVSLNMIATFLMMFGGIHASKHMHNNMLNCIFRAPMSFFDTTPSGRILNRFSKDMESMDNEIATFLRFFIMNFLRALVAFAMISIQSALILLPILPLATVYYLIYRLYIPSSRQLKRIESTSRSPILDHFSETISGTASIRAFGVNDRFRLKLNELIDAHNKCFYSSFTVSRWLAIRLEFIGYTILFIAAIFAVVYKDSVTPGVAGLSISYAINITSILGVLVKSFSDLETSVVAVERCLEYTRIQSEAQQFDNEIEPNESWPQNGVIEFDKYSTRYREGLEPVLNQISFRINSSEKVGIVGRTGSGKSTLALTLFRIIEPIEGTIIVDDIDITKLGLFNLRSNLTVIPQDSALFSGTLRMNLDPYGHSNDAEIWRVLEMVNLKEFVRTQSDELEFEILAEGDNLSAGQKQLICLARALLRKTKILVLDEATAAVDLETDAIIQSAIRSEFKDCTILTIAHRLNTIIDYDRVIVIENGHIVEFDAPLALLANDKSAFYSFAKEANIV